MFRKPILYNIIACLLLRRKVSPVPTSVLHITPATSMYDAAEHTLKMLRTYDRSKPSSGKHLRQCFSAVVPSPAFFASIRRVAKARQRNRILRRISTTLSMRSETNIAQRKIILTPRHRTLSVCIETKVVRQETHTNTNKHGPGDGSSQSKLSSVGLIRKYASKGTGGQGAVSRHGCC